MTKRITEWDHQTRCDECGWVSKPTSKARAEYALRKHSCELTRKRQLRAHRVARRKASSGPVRSCWHKRAFHRHGTALAYKLDKCRCRPCRDAVAAEARELKRRNLYGRGNLVDAEPVLAHLRELMAAGMGWKRVAQAAGLATSTVYPILYGRPTQPRPVRLRIRRATAGKILAVRLDLADGTPVDATGARRRLQALVALGWPRAQLAARLGVLDSNLARSMRSGHVAAGTERAVRVLYDELSMRLPEPTEWRAKIAISRARRSAQRLGWRPPLAWDEDEIDVPVINGTSYVADLIEPVQFYYRRGLGDRAIGRELGRSKDTVRRVRAHLGLPAHPRPARKAA